MPLHEFGHLPGCAETPLTMGRAAAAVRDTVDAGSVVPLALLGPGNPANLRLLVRFGITDNGAIVERWPAQASLTFGSGGIE